MKLSKKITLLFSLAILFSIFIVSVISNRMINNTFDEYLIGEQQQSIEQISEEINELYRESDYQLSEDQIDSYASLEDVTIRIEDNQGNLIYSSERRMGMGGMHGMMGGNMSEHHQNMMRDHGMTEGEYVEDTFNLLQRGQPVGTVNIGYIDNSFLTESAFVFKDTLARILILAGIVAVVIGILTSIFLANSLTKPLINIKNTSQEMQKGNLTTKADPNTDIIEIQELSDSINYLGETLSQQETIRKEYAADISHELRTPISTLKSHVEAIMDGVWEPNAKHLGILMHEIERLASLIDDLKDSFNSEEAGILLNKTYFNLSKSVEEIVTTFEPIIHQEGLSITEAIEQEVVVRMDQDRIKQVLYNLLSNAVKYSPKGGKIKLTLMRLTDEKVRLIVEDTGVGIPKEDLPFLFERFYRIDASRSKASGGTGLGLAIVQSIIEEHGGAISVESVYGEGSSFIIDLPTE